MPGTGYYVRAVSVSHPCRQRGGEEKCSLGSLAPPGQLAGVELVAGTGRARPMLRMLPAGAFWCHQAEHLYVMPLPTPLL